MKFRGIFSRKAPILFVSLGLSSSLSYLPQAALGFQFQFQRQLQRQFQFQAATNYDSFGIGSRYNLMHHAKSSHRFMVTESSASTSTSTITSEDNHYMKLALEAAAKGVGNTYPNPAVGCVLVSSGTSAGAEDGDRDRDDIIIGTGFHPKAGYPHAEVFALLEACGYVDSGVDAASVVVECTKGPEPAAGADVNDNAGMVMNRVDELLQQYSAPDGAKELFDQKFAGQDVTAYVTLEPCCHYGKTPPCAVSLRMAGVNRVVVGFRDPNPKVDGGGVTVLKDQDVRVDLMSMNSSSSSDADEMENAKACADIVSSFVKRIAPRIDDEMDGKTLADYSISMNGAKRSLLRSIAGRWKKEGIMTEMEWPRSHPSIDVEKISSSEGYDWDQAVEELPIHHGWMESVDGKLWEKEMILLRLNQAVAKKKGVKFLGERIAKELGAHVAQVVGHTVLLYRPGRPPILDLSTSTPDSDE